MNDDEQKALVPVPKAPLEGWDRLKADWKRFSRFAAKLGIALAIICHMLPPHYRAPCDALAQLCKPFGD